jgi:3-dehydroquinate dehydratase-1
MEFRNMAGTGGICISIADKNPEGVLASGRRVSSQADVIEIRLDYLDKPVISPFVEELELPLLFTCRPEWEGGEFSGSEVERADLLEEAIARGASYVDIELKSDEKIRQRIIEAARSNKVKSIVSWHHFKNTPSSQALESILQEQYRSGADIGKIVTMAQGFQDVLRVLDLQVLAAEMSFPLCAFCMGQAGMISRIATLELGGYMSYAAPDGGAVTAPGQLPASEMRSILEIFNAKT